MRIGKAGNSNNIFNRSRVVNLISALKHKVDFDRIKFVSPRYDVPPIVSFGDTLYVNNKCLTFDPNNNPVNLNDLIKHSALAILNKGDFKGRNLMKASSRLGFIFDTGSRRFLIADALAGMGHQTLMGGLWMLRDANALNTKLDKLMKGAFKIDERGGVSSAIATLFNSAPSLAADKKLMRGLFYEMALGLKYLGCSEKMEIGDMIPPLISIKDFLKKNGIASLGDIIEKFSPQRLYR